MFLVIKSFLKKYKIETILFVCAFAAQMAVFALVIKYGSAGFLWSSDTESYFTLAKNLLSHGGFFIRSEWGLSAFRTPLYPMFVAVLYWMIPQLWFVILIQNILGAISVVLVYRFVKYVFGSKVAILSSVLFLIESQRLHVTNQLMSETLFMVLFIPALHFFFKFRAVSRYSLISRKVSGMSASSSQRKNFFVLCAGIFLGLSTLTKPITQFLPLVMILFILADLSRAESRERPLFKTIKKNLAAAFILLSVFLATISPWVIRNKIHFDVWKLSPIGGTNLYFVNAGHFLQYRAKYSGENKEFYTEMTDKALSDLNLKLDRSQWVEQSIRLMEFDYEPYFSREAFKIISSDPFLYARVHLGRMIPFLIDSSLSRSGSAISFNMPHRSNRLFYPYFYWGGRMIWTGFFITIALAVTLNWWAIRKRIWAWTFFVLVILYFGALAAMNWDAPRMRLPINPLIFMMFGESVFLLINRLRYKKDKV